ncbi:MAG: PilZ domain-containing protein [Candidatus Omnitrophica bacterium]|nr:PilZ domain-containing protein [Candidatus Omnitrophota bacterium]
MENPAVKEKRAFGRFPVQIMLRYLNLDSSEKESLAATHDISVRGLCLVSDEPLPRDTPLDIWLYVSDAAEQIYVKGRVIWSDNTDSSKYRIGVSLENAAINPIFLALKSIQFRIRQFQRY